MSRFTDRLERDLAQIADHASPSATTAWELIHTRIDEEVDQYQTEIIMLSPDPAKRERTVPARLMATIAAAAALVVVGGFILSNQRNQDSVTVEPDPTVTTAPDSDPEPDPAQVKSDAIATGERFVGAFVNLDPDAAVDMLVDEPTRISVDTADDAESLRRWIAHRAAVGTEFQLQDCDFSEPNFVTCEVLWRNAWFEAGDFPPVEATFFLSVDGDEIDGVRYAFDYQNLDVPYSQFRDYVRDNHPDEVGALWVEENGIIQGPSLTDEANEIFEVRTAEYLASLPGG